MATAEGGAKLAPLPSRTMRGAISHMRTGLQTRQTERLVTKATNKATAGQLEQKGQTILVGFPLLWLRGAAKGSEPDLSTPGSWSPGGPT